MYDELRQSDKFAYDVIKGKYSKDDIDNLLEKIKEDYENYQYLKQNKKIY